MMRPGRNHFHIITVFMPVNVLGDFRQTLPIEAPNKIDAMIQHQHAYFQLWYQEAIACIPNIYPISTNSDDGIMYEVGGRTSI